MGHDEERDPAVPVLSRLPGGPLRTQVGIIGAGPAGLTLAPTARARRHRHRRPRVAQPGLRRAAGTSGVLEQATVELLDDAGVGDRMTAEGLVHHGVVLQVDGDAAPAGAALTSPMAGRS